ncbi:MAG TPA: ATP-binding SpoIIE family protein phosphatase [Anaeromyxobacteraceae bacterium]|jgi:anti-sigma regulatory factor (Ser/Thr protein kinase)|nr:ATP-binding SpoIIE family protein phosphatase [Anaeromyxobacteraceae bacterium]
MALTRGASTLVLPLSHLSQVGESRRRVTAEALGLGFSEVKTGRAALVATEAARNVVLHGGGGELLVRTLERHGERGLELLAIDRGPGMDLAQALRDGFSTAGTSGQGLGALLRLSDEFDAWSRPGRGAAVLSRIWSGAVPPAGPVRWGAVSAPLPGEVECGDGWAVAQRGSVTLALVVDGLGHGPLASAAAREAERTFAAYAGDDPVELLSRAHDAMRATRGGALAVAALRADAHEVLFAGLGNVSGSVVEDAASRQMVSMNGTAGLEVHRFRSYRYPWQRGALVVLHSDGVATRWQLPDYPGLAGRDPSLAAAVLYRDFRRGRDDATVLVLRAVPS